MNATSVSSALAPYRHCPHAIAWFELYICPGEDEATADTCLGIFIASKMSPADVVKSVQRLLREEFDEPQPSAGTAQLRAALEQTHLPEFLTYVAGRMGAM